ncbi:MAG: response regulator transcription factor [Candidatus Promineifilaceae bacterium]|nr:response regulator transcription factor [Candidatus Promineifilaceae bacterium]
MMAQQKVLVVDDDPEVVRLMRAYLQQAGYEVFVAYDGESAVHNIRREKPDLILLDLMLPDRDGFDITRLVRNDSSLAHIPIIMLTARVEDTDKIIGLELGADDYVTKPYNPREVVARVRARLRNQAAALPNFVRVGGLEMDVDRHQVEVDGRFVALTPTEFNLLHVLMQQEGFVFTRAELIRRGLGLDYEGLERTLDSHMRNLRQKIEPDPQNPTYIHTVYGVGYRLALG